MPLGLVVTHLSAPSPGNAVVMSSPRGLADVDCNDDPRAREIEKETCKKHPIINFILFALKNFQNWQSQMIDALDNQHDSFQDQMNDMVQKFTVHDLSSV